MKRGALWKWSLVGALGFTAWLVPLAGALWRFRARETKSAPPPLSPQATQPLILVADGWPTRARLNFDEIQGATEVSESTLAPKTIASDLQRELAELGVVAEPRRFDSLPADFDPGRFRPIVFIYPVRHGQPAQDVLSFIDRRLEPWLGRHGLEHHPALTDLVITEKAGDSQPAQQNLIGIAQYYQLHYRPGPELNEASTWTQQEEMVRAQAQAIRASLAP